MGKKVVSRRRRRGEIIFPHWADSELKRVSDLLSFVAMYGIRYDGPGSLVTQITDSDRELFVRYANQIRQLISLETTHV